jgi:hypothetical protein
MKRFLLFALLSLLPSAALAQIQPLVTSLDPSSTIAGSTDMTLTVNGGNFTSGATVNWNGSAKSTVFVSASQLTATINAAQLATPGAAQVSVTQSGFTTTPLIFQILLPYGNVTSYSPTQFTAGVGANIEVYGQDFDPAAVIFFDWKAVSTTWDSPNHLTGIIPNFDITGNGPHKVFVYNAAVPAGQPSLNLPQQPVNFGGISVTVTSAGSFSVTNVSPASVTLGSPYYALTGLNAADFVNPGGTGTCTNGQVLAPSAHCTIFVSYTPSVQGNEIAIVTVNSNGTGNPQNVTIKGQGIPPAAPQLSLLPTNLSFGNQQQSTTSSTILSTVSNSGNANLTISGISVSGTNSGDFALTGGTCTTSTTLAPNANCTIGIQFTPSSTNTESAQVSITDNAVGSPHTISLFGNGIATATHYVTLTWNASDSSNLVGYNVYRGTQTGGPYTLLTPTPLSTLGYTDAAVTHGTPYFYVVTVVGANPPYSPTESSNSNESSATP